MATRDSWTIDLRCPTCGANGTAEVSEDERPDGFRVRKLGSTMLATKFECALCGELTV
jgi:predicted RNA-binding Zn-ribbon protein involved in translation (DUF1610 family)